jgi:hypothetical protein
VFDEGVQHRVLYLQLMFQLMNSQLGIKRREVGGGWVTEAATSRLRTSDVEGQ